MFTETELQGIKNNKVTTCCHRLLPVVALYCYLQQLMVERNLTILF